MLLIRDLDEMTPGEGQESEVVLTLGVFDGVHLGHRHLIGETVRRARELGCRSAAITFDPHPASVVRGEALPLLTSMEERHRLMRQLDLDVIARVHFTPELARLTAIEFMAHMTRHLRPRELWVGPDFALGRGREGSLARLAEIGQAMGFLVQAVAPLQIDGQVVSSTRIRGLLSRGDVAGAGRLLGHCFSFTGDVIAGDHRGRLLGYPTANMKPDPARALPPDGVYACHCFIDPAPGPVSPGRQVYQAVVSLGVRPTFGEGARLAEAYLLDFSGDLYGRTLTLHFVDRLRGELRFTSIGGLVEQIGCDVVRAREILAGGGLCALA